MQFNDILQKAVHHLRGLKTPAKRLPSEALRLYHTYPIAITVIVGGLALCCLLGVAILQEKEIKKKYQKISVIPLSKSINVQTPHQDPRPEYGYVNTIVLHALPETNPAEWLARTRNLRERFSVHYAIAPDGTLYSHASEDKRTWHTPIGRLPNTAKQVNAFSLGIGLMRSPTTSFIDNDKQLQTLFALLNHASKRYVILWIAGASQVSRDVRTDYLDAELPFERLNAFADKFIYPLPGTVDSREDANE